jgi:hypothetical protein
MNLFLQRHENSVTGMLNGFDRVRFRGTLRLLASVGGMGAFLAYVGVLLKEFGEYVQAVTRQVRQATLDTAEAAGRPVVFVSRPSTSKEDLAREIARRDGIKEGLICVLSAVEVLWSYDIHRNRKTKLLELVPVTRKCLHYYHYFLHPQLGFMHARLATWFPLTIQVCINGREWLARQMDAAGIGYVRRDNCFTHLHDPLGAQRLMADQLKTNWPALLQGIAGQVNALTGDRLSAKCPVDYYWSADQTEWASDVMFKSPEALAKIYPGLVHHAMEVLGCRDVLRFLGKRVRNDGQLCRNFVGEVSSDLAQRPEGMRVKHRLNGNAIKMYDKQGSVLRVETIVNEPRDMKVYRTPEGAPDDAPKHWHKMRKGVADLHRRAELSQAANDRYLASMACVEDKKLLGELSGKLCRPTTWKGRRVRAMNPFSPDDAALLEAVDRGEFCLSGFGNRDLRRLLHGQASSKEQQRRQSASVSRKVRMLRAHGLVRKIPARHRYQLSASGRTIINALLAARQADTALLAKAA